MRIFLSAGHSIKDSGAVYAGIRESDLNMRIRDCVKRLIPECFVVPDNLDLVQSVDWVNGMASPEDLFLETHLNFNNNLDISGCESYYYDDYNIAEIFSRNVAREIELPNRGARYDSESAVGKLYVLRNIKCNSVLVEVCYLSNPIDRQKILYPSTQEKVAVGIKKAIDEWQGRNQIRLKIIELYKQIISLLTKQYEQKIRLA